MRIIRELGGDITFTFFVDENEGDHAYITQNLDDHHFVSGSTDSPPDEWANSARIDKELTEEQVLKLFQAIREVFDEM